MAGINKVILIGQVEKAPVLEHTADGIPFAYFRISTTEVSHKVGDHSPHTEWHQCVIWRTPAEMAVRLLRPGATVHIDGKLRLKDGLAEIQVQHFTLPGRKRDH